MVIRGDAQGREMGKRDQKIKKRKAKASIHITELKGLVRAQMFG